MYESVYVYDNLIGLLIEITFCELQLASKFVRMYNFILLVGAIVGTQASMYSMPDLKVSFCYYLICYAHY